MHGDPVDPPSIPDETRFPYGVISCKGSRIFSCDIYVISLVWRGGGSRGGFYFQSIIKGGLAQPLELPSPISVSLNLSKTSSVINNPTSSLGDHTDYLWGSSERVSTYVNAHAAAAAALLWEKLIPSTLYTPSGVERRFGTPGRRDVFPTLTDFE